MFGRWRREREQTPSEPTLRCSFCKRSQDDVRKLIAGPTVFICDDCVQVCVDLISDDTRTEEQVRKRLEAEAAQQTPPRSAIVTCTTCRLPLVLEEALTIENGAILCRPCVSAIQAAAEDEESANCE